MMVAPKHTEAFWHGGRRTLRLALVPVALAVAGCSGAGTDKPSPAAKPAAVTSSAEATPNASTNAPAQPDLAHMVDSVMRQLQRATTGEGGTPRAITAEEAIAILQSQADLARSEPRFP